MKPRLIFDAHLDLSYNALDFNRDLRWPLERVRRHELGMRDHVFRSRGVVSFPEMRRGRIGLCVATQLARYVDRFSKMPGWNSPEQAWAWTQGQHAWHREMERAGELLQLRTGSQVTEHAKRWQDAVDATAALTLVRSRAAAVLASLVEFVVIPRPGAGEAALPAPFRLKGLEGFPLKVSSSEIRDRVIFWLW